MSLCRFALLFTLLPPLFASASVSPCLAPGESSIDGLHPNMPESVLGERAMRRSPEQLRGEDDGGEYLATKYLHKYYEAIVVRNAVDSVATESPEIVWYRGIRVGMKKAEVESRMAITPTAYEVGAVHYAVCSESYEGYAVLHYRDETLVRIVIFTERP